MKILMNKLNILVFLRLWCIASSNDVVAERVLDFQQGAHVLCPGLTETPYCDCGHDCDNQPTWCACEEAKTCCASYLSDKPEIVFHVLGICSASLSVIGSCAILFKILRGIGSTTPYDRIIFGLSTGNIIASITIVVDHVLAPNKTSSLEFCETLNPISQLSSVWSVWYNNLLSVYFLMMVLSQLKRKDLVQKYERWMHISGIIVPINVIMLIYIYGYGEDYAAATCYLADLGILFIGLGIPFWLSLLSIVINYGRIYAVVRKSLRANESSEQLAGPMPRQERLIKEVTTLMILYVGSFLVTWIPSFVYGILFNLFEKTPSDLYPVRVLVATTLPLQGFLNAFIYFKPAYTRFRAANPNKSMRFVLHQALFNRTAPKTNYHLTDPSGTDPSASAPIAEEDVGVGITGIDFESALLFVNASGVAFTAAPVPVETSEEEPPAERNDSPLEAVDSNS